MRLQRNDVPGSVGQGYFFRIHDRNGSGYHADFSRTRNSFRLYNLSLVNSLKKLKLHLTVCATKNFFFTRLQYESGDWDVDQRMPANLLNSLIEYTTIPVDTQENIVPLNSSEIFRCPFCYLSGHKLVEFTATGT